MNVDAVFKTIDSKGRQVLVARLEDGTEGVIRYENNARIVAGSIVKDYEIEKAYKVYSLQ